MLWKEQIMFERCTEKARRVIFFGRYEASQFGSPYIETEHLLLGLFREDKALTHRCLHSQANVKSIRNQIEAHTTFREKTSTSVDLPLSNESKRVLAYAAEEADRLSDTHIGTEHLLLGLLRESRSFAAQLLNSQGVSLDKTREIISKWQRTTEAPLEIVRIHGEEWDAAYLREQLPELQKFAWRKRQWKPLDTLVEISSGRIFFDTTLKDDLDFKLVIGGWPREFCTLCHWELNADGGGEHTSGYTNGREWLCIECYEGLVEPTDKPLG